MNSHQLRMFSHIPVIEESGHPRYGENFCSKFTLLYFHFFFAFSTLFQLDNTSLCLEPSLMEGVVHRHQIPNHPSG
jgi:hypothetical protein